jgi:protein-tyrosine phosphatase
MSGYIDLHLHYVPSVDDGVKTVADAVRLCQGLASIGFAQLVTTPHIRSGMFENRKPGLVEAFNALKAEVASAPNMPALDLSAEHHCDSVFMDLLQAGELLPYPGGRSLLVEFAADSLPLGFEQLLFRIGLKGLRPVLAHPERYSPLFKSTRPLERFIEQDLGLQLDLMSLIGKYGRTPQRAAERMVEEGVYTVAASDAHHPDDVPRVAQAISALIALVGDDEADILLRENPARLLAGQATL